MTCHLQNTQCHKSTTDWKQLKSWRKAKFGDHPQSLLEHTGFSMFLLPWRKQESLQWAQKEERKWAEHIYVGQACVKNIHWCTRYMYLTRFMCEVKQRRLTPLLQCEDFPFFLCVKLWTVSNNHFLVVIPHALIKVWTSPHGPDSV